MPDLSSVVRHLVDHVLPAAAEYQRAEVALSAAYTSSPNAAAGYAEAGRATVRAASNVAIAIDGLTERMHNATGISKSQIRRLVQTRCKLGYTERVGCIERVRGVAVVYKHERGTERSLPVKRDEDVVAVGAGYGTDGFGVGKFGGVEVIVEESAGARRKFLGDVPAGIRGWAEYLQEQGASLPGETRDVCGIEIIV